MLDAATTTALASADPSDYHGCYSIRAPRWAVVYTHPQAERWANSNLTRRGYVTYLPLCTLRVRDRVTPSMLHTVHRPLFSRYLFIRFNHHADSWSPIRDTPGVLDLVRSGPEVHYATEAEISALQAAEASRRCQTAETTQWAPGTPVAVANGVLQNCHGVVVASHTDRDMATVAIMMAGHLCRLLVHIDHLVPAGETAQ